MQKITPFLWFKGVTKEAVDFYVSVFNNSKVESIQYYPEGVNEGPMAGMDGKVLTAVFTLEGQKFMALDGGDEFKFSPAMSFFVNCEDSEEVNQLYEKLVENGKVLMALDKYDFSERYAWIEDKYGVSWQLNAGKGSQKISPAMLFVGDMAGKTEEAINFYVSLFEDSKVENIYHYGPEHKPEKEENVMYSMFKLFGQEFIAMESSAEHDFKMTGAISLYIECEDQDEVDKYWNALKEGGTVMPCGWVADKYGVTWQVIPRVLDEMTTDPDKEKADRAIQAMLKMEKIDIATIQRAFDGE